MVGMEVIVMFVDGFFEIVIWGVVVFGVGGVFGLIFWGVLLDGDLFGDFDLVIGDLFGGFLMMNFYDFDMVLLLFNVLVVGFVFDIVYFDVLVNGLGFGCELVFLNVDVFVVYFDNYMDELFGIMILLSFS